MAIFAQMGWLTALKDPKGWSDDDGSEGVIVGNHGLERVIDGEHK